MEELLAQWAASAILAHPRIFGSAVALVVLSTIVATVGDAWRRKTDPEKAALLAGNVVTGGVYKVATAWGLPVLRMIDGVIAICQGALNLVAKARGKDLPFPPVDRAILTSRPGESPTAIVVQPATQTVLPAIVARNPSPLPTNRPTPTPVRAARAEAAAEHRAAANTEERLP